MQQPFTSKQLFYPNSLGLQAQLLFRCLPLVFYRIKVGYKNIGQPRPPAPAPFPLTADEHNDEVKD